MAQQTQNVNSTIEKKEPIKGNRLYVRWEVSDDALRNPFEKFGKITEARVVRGPRLRAFGFVTYETESDAVKALAAMNGKEFTTSPLHVEYASSDKSRKQPRQQQRPRYQEEQTLSGQAQQPQGAPPGGLQRNNGGQQRNGGGQQRNQGRQGTGGNIGGGNQRQRPRQRPKPVGSMEMKDPNYGKQVILNPNPITTPIPKEASMTTLDAGQRLYRSGRNDPVEGKQVATLVLNVEPGKGPFTCDFKLGLFELKLLSVLVESKTFDTRVYCRVLHPAANRARDVYFRHVKSETRHKFLELRPPTVDGADPPTETFFVTIDNINLDVVSGLWKKIVLSLVSVPLPKRSPQTAQQPQQDN